jgi:ribosomal protein S18 acetylase RimI-like enzyme
MTDIRQAHETDLPHIYEICLATGNAGDDASPLLSDRFIIGQYYAAAYIVHDMDMCFVLTKDGIPSGYVVGTCDTLSFNGWLSSYWLPPLRRVYPQSMVPKSLLEKHLVDIINSGPQDDEFAGEYPAHLHIDILSSCQGKGFGRKLIGCFMNKCVEKKCAGFHLGVDARNRNALDFYKKIGMNVLKEEPGSVVMGMKL